MEPEQTSPLLQVILTSAPEGCANLIRRSSGLWKLGVSSRQLANPIHWGRYPGAKNAGMYNLDLWAGAPANRARRYIVDIMLNW
jgi:hypothetical protein